MLLFGAVVITMTSATVGWPFAFLGDPLEQPNDLWPSLTEDVHSPTIDVFDPWTTPTASDLDLDRLRYAWEQFDPNTACPPSLRPTYSDDLIEILRLSDGCLTLEYEELSNRPLEEVRETYLTDRSILAIDRPVIGVALAEDTHATECFPDVDASDPLSHCQWHLNAIDAEALHTGWPEEAVVTVAVMDTGVDAEHLDLKNSLIDEASDVGLEADYFGPDNGRVDVDPEGHGTQIAGVIASSAHNGLYGRGVAPNAKIRPITTISEEPSGWYLAEQYCDSVKRSSPGNSLDSSTRDDLFPSIPSVTEALIALLQKPVDVINMSFSLAAIKCGRWRSVNRRTPAKESGMIMEDSFAIREAYLNVIESPPSTVEAAIRLVQASGMIVVAAGGNCGIDGSFGAQWHSFWITQCTPNQRIYPAAFDGVLAVAATTEAGEVAGFSSAAEHITIAAPGVNIFSVAPNNQWGSNYGTSHAAAVVTGIVAHLKARFPDEDSVALVQALYQTADNPHAQVTNDLGYGHVRPRAAIKWLSSAIDRKEIHGNSPLKELEEREEPSELSRMMNEIKNIVVGFLGILMVVVALLGMLFIVAARMSGRFLLILAIVLLCIILFVMSVFVSELI